MDGSDLVGKQIDHYTIVRHIARGGMADVYLAHEEGLNRQVALKVLLPVYIQQSEFKTRFIREAQAAANLNHPNIIRIYFTGQTPVGEPYFTMEYCSRGTLESWLEKMNRKGTLLPTIQSLSLVRQIADALRVAHHAGIVHRDIKPSNILIHENGTPVLSDLGIAAITTASRLTRTGTLMGTPQYMSPEQAAGNPVDGRSDIYSLGIILYELLAGQRPFDAEESLAVLHKQLYEQPAPLRHIRKGLSRQTFRVIEGCLQKQPSQRFQSATELVAVLDKALFVEGKPATRKIRVKRDEDPIKKLPWHLAFTRTFRLVVTIVIAGIFIILVWSLAGREISSEKDSNNAVELALSVTNSVGGGPTSSKWVVVMTESSEDLQQRILLKPVFPKEWINSNWADGFDVTSLAYGDGLWAVVMTDSDENFRQWIRLQSEFPRKLIETQWAKGTDVASLVYGDGLWAVVMTDSDENFRQWIRLQSEFPQKLIETQWAKGTDVTSLEYGDGLWAVVMTDSDENRRQWILGQDAFPRELIESQWADGFGITNLVYGDGDWVVVMTENDERHQLIHRQSEFPRDLIEARWAEGSDITTLAFGSDG